MNAQDRQLMQQALDVLEKLKRAFFKNAPDEVEDWERDWVDPAINSIAALRKRLSESVAQPEQQEPVAMPSNTRYTVEVEGQARTYWDNIHDAITNAQRAVYAGVDATTRAIDDLKAGRLAEWCYGFSAVRIYPPQTFRPQAREWVGLTDEEVMQTMSGDWTSVFYFARAIEAKLREKNAAPQTAQQPRQWQGLTDEDIIASHPYSVTRDKGCFHAGAAWANRELREKNT